MPSLSLTSYAVVIGLSLVAAVLPALTGLNAWLAAPPALFGGLFLVLMLRSLSNGLGQLRLACAGTQCQDDAPGLLPPECAALSREIADHNSRARGELGFALSLVKGFPLPMITVDRDAAITFVNQPALDMLQIPGSPADWIGRKAGEFFYQDPTRDTNVAKVMRESMDKITGETVLTGRLGRKVNVQADRLKLFDLDGRLIGGLCVYTDLTAIRESEKIAVERAESMRQAASHMERLGAELFTASRALDREIVQATSGATDQRDRVARAAEEIRGLTGSVAQVAANADAAASAALQTQEKAREGAAVVERSMEAIRKVEITARDLSENMDALSESSRSIGGVLDMITDIADQTNLLALNAAIEAARAGDAGRGFAVVADEVRKLAEKTMAATRQVGESVAAIQQSASSNLDRVQEAARLIEQSTALAGESGKALEGILDMARLNAARARDIASSAEAQSAGAESVASVMEEVRRIAEGTSSGMDKASRAVHALADTASGLETLIARLGQGREDRALT